MRIMGRGRVGIRGRVRGEFGECGNGENGENVENGEMLGLETGRNLNFLKTWHGPQGIGYGAWRKTDL